MVDDVIHDKYERNTKDYYIYRNKEDEKSLKIQKENLILYDNLAVGYDFLGELENALNIYKTKKSIMDNNNSDDENRYRYYANLGTFLIHDGLKKWSIDNSDSKAKNTLIQGRDYIAKAIKINVNAHFGRENYQLIAVNNLIESFTNKSFLNDKNILGKKSLDYSLLDKNNNLYTCGNNYYDLYPEIKKKGKIKIIQKLDSCPMALKGLIGMIRYGGGPNPISYSAIGDILVSMGEYKLAFSSYMRAVEMKNPYSNNIISYSKLLANKIYPNIPQEDAYNKLFSQYKKDILLGKTWSDNYLNYQKNIIIKGIDPRLPESYDEYYNIYKHPFELNYDR